jgi:hypothetical protein
MVRKEDAADDSVKARVRFTILFRNGKLSGRNFYVAAHQWTRYDKKL